MNMKRERTVYHASKIVREIKGIKCANLLNHKNTVATI